MTVTVAEALDLPFRCGDLDGIVTIRDFFKAQLSALWEEGEGFSGKRPLGNSGWEQELAVPLIAAGLLKGDLVATDDEGNEVVYDPKNDEHYVEAEDYDYGDYDRLVQKLIGAL